jgi:sugar lactone lactonase YvrE
VKGIVHTFIGTGKPGYSGDAGSSSEALVNGPAGLAIDSNNNVYVVEIINNVVRKIDTKINIVTTVAGCGDKGFSGDGGLAVKAKLNGPEGVFVDLYGNIYIADTWNQRIRKIDFKSGIIKTIAGNGEAGFSGDGGNACNASINRPSGVVVDSIGNVYFNDYSNERIRKIDINGIISTFAGTGEAGFTGDEGLAYQAKINDVYGLAIDKNDNLYFVDSLNFAIRKINLHSGVIYTVCGKGKPGEIVEFVSVDSCYLGGNAHPKGTTGGSVPHGLDVSNEGFILIADTGVNRIRVADLFENQVYTIAGTGEGGYSGDEENALEAKINVHGVRVDSEGNIYFVDFHHHVVRKITFK